MPSQNEQKPQYRLAKSDADYQAALALFEEHGFFTDKANFPTVLCYEGDRLIGALATQQLPDMIVAGPMAMEPYPSGRNRVADALAMCEFYESTMRSIGIRSFIFYAEEGSPMANAVAWYTPENKPYAKEGSKLFFVRHIDGR